MTIKAVLHRIIVKPESVEDTDEILKSAKSLGIHIELDPREKHAIEVGTVIQIGNTVFKEFGTSPSEENISIGSKVIFAKYAGKKIVDEGQEFLVLNDEDIVGVYV